MRTALLFFAVTCSLSGVLSASAVADNTFTDAERDTIQEFITKCVAGSKSAVVVGLVDENGKTIHAAGTLDNGNERPVNGDSLFFIGSVSKSFTDLVLLDMVRRSEVKLDDPATKYLPESLKVPTFAGKQIRLIDLATHTSGLPINPNNMLGAGEREQYESYSIEQMYAFLASHELAREPGTQYSYSNVGFALLGNVLSRRAARPYESLVVERICRPLGMYDTRIALDDGQRARLAMGHAADGSASRPWTFDAYQPAGNIHSSTNDLLDYAAAHAGLTSSPLKSILEQSHVFRFREDMSNSEVGPMGRTAMDWVDRNAVQPPGMELLGHAGGAGSYHAWVGFDLKQKRGVVVLSTNNSFSVEAIGWTILQRLPLTEERKLDFARQIVGVGVALRLVGDGKGGVSVDRVLPDSPAARADLAVGLVIVEIDGETTTGKTLIECVKLIRGPAGSKVRLKVLSGEDDEPKTIELTRQPFAT